MDDVPVGRIGNPSYELSCWVLLWTCTEVFTILAENPCEWSWHLLQYVGRAGTSPAPQRFLKEGSAMTRVSTPPTAKPVSNTSQTQQQQTKIPHDRIAMRAY